MNLLQKIEKEQNKNHNEIRTGNSVRVHVKIVEGDKERVQVFEGVVIGLRRQGSNRGSFIVRKVSYGVGVERIFPLNAPSIEKIEVVNKNKIRRARLYYLRKRFGKNARLRDGNVRQVAGVDGAVADAAAQPSTADQAAQ